MLQLAEETKIFDFLSCMKFRASNFSVCIKTDFEGQFIVSDMSEIFEFPSQIFVSKFWSCKIDLHPNVNREMFKWGEFNVIIKMIYREASPRKIPNLLYILALNRDFFK